MFKIFITQLLLLGSSYAATFNVSTTAEFRQALSDAAINGEDDSIYLADGTYSILDDGEGTFHSSGTYGAGDFDDMNLTITNLSNGAILDGANSDTIIDLRKLQTLHFENITFQNVGGDYNYGLYLKNIQTVRMENCGLTSIEYEGVYIRNDNGFTNGASVEINNTFFTQIRNGQGAIYVSADSIKDLIINNSTFDTILNNYGIHISSSLNQNVTSVTVNNSVFSNFSSLYALKGFKTNWNLNQCRFENNSYDGALLVGVSDDLPDIVINDCTFNNNKILNSTLNGEIFIQSAKSVKIINSQFTHSGYQQIEEDNYIYISGTPNIIIDRVLFSDIVGKGLAIYDSSILLLNSIMKNINAYYGPVYFSSSETNIINSMLLNNKSEYYGDKSFDTGVLGDNTTNVINSFILNNGVSLSSGVSTFYNSSLPAYVAYGIPLFYNNIDMPTGSVEVNNGHFTFEYIDILDDQNISLVDNSYVYDKGIALDSPEIAALIDNAEFNEYLDQNNQYDFLGNPRIDGSGIDVGPIEYLSTPILPTIPTDVIATDGTLEFVVGVSWSEVSKSDYYNVYRSDSQAEIGDIVGVITGTSFVDDTVEENTTYYYRVNACNDEGCSDYSIADSGYIGTISTPINPAIIMYLLN